MYTVIFKIPSRPDVKVQAERGENLLELARRVGVAISSPCAGNGTCGKCRVKLISGDVETEKNIRLSDEDYAEQWRLACPSRICGDAVIWIPGSARAFRNSIKTADLSSPEELIRYFAATDKVFSAGLERGCAETGVGVAVDIGTTTVTAAMLDLATGQVLAKSSMGNGQIRYGADVINRIIQAAKPGGGERLRHLVCEETVVPIFESLCDSAGKTADDISRVVISGNTTMEHLFVGADVQSIRLEPFVPEFLELHGQTAGGLGLPAKADAPVIFAPNAGSYVGGDISAGLLPSMLWNSDDLSLFIDLGTNGELVLGNRDFMLCCACSAGPAFEGGDISCGMRATDGAVDYCTIDAETMEPTLSLISDDKPLGICGSGLIAMIGELFRCGIISAQGKFIREGPRIRNDEYGGAAYIFAYPEESATGSALKLTESDLDNFIRAKAAVFSAIRTMLNSLDMTVDDIEHIIIAGGIGSGIDIEKAVSIGMLPKVDLSKYSCIGNSSLTGACLMLQSEEATEKVFEIGRNMTYVELSMNPRYMDEFVAACFLPHTDETLFAEN